jgi:hypothetical protein
MKPRKKIVEKFIFHYVLHREKKNMFQHFSSGATFNNALIEQAIARACRYKSQYNLPKNQQKGFVYRLLIDKETDVDLINKIYKNIIKISVLSIKDLWNNQKKYPY